VSETHPAQARPRRRGRKVLITLVVLVLILGGLLVLADRVALGVAERAIARQAEREVANQNVSSSPPEVSIGGFPFLTQVLAEKYDSITIVAHDASGEVQGETVELPRLEIVARDVHASLETIRSGQGDVIAQTVDGTGVVGYDSVARFVDQPGVVLGEQNGKLTVTAPVELLGQQFTLHGVGELVVDEAGKVRMRFENLTAEGLPDIPVAQTLLTNYARQLSIQIPLPELPYQMRVTEVRPLPEGLEVSATAKDVPLNAL